MRSFIYLRLVLNYDDIIGGAQFSPHLHTIIAVNSITKYDPTIKHWLENLNNIKSIKGGMKQTIYSYKKSLYCQANIIIIIILPYYFPKNHP